MQSTGKFSSKSKKILKKIKKSVESKKKYDKIK